MRRLVDYIRMRLRVSHVVQEFPAEFLRDIRTQASIDRKPLRFFLSFRKSQIKDFRSLLIVIIESLTGFYYLCNSIRASFVLV